MRRRGTAAQHDGADHDLEGDARAEPHEKKISRADRRSQKRG
jgi:hypothetical protein